MVLLWYSPKKLLIHKDRTLGRIKVIDNFVDWEFSDFPEAFPHPNYPFD
jgi:hypothetical protein